MYCRKCGEQIEDDSLFCRHCGAEAIIEKVSEGAEEDIGNRNTNISGEQLIHLIYR